MTTNEKIVRWLGFKNIRNIKFPDIGLCIVDGVVPIKLDFLHDRNQQKWIEDKLIKDGYEIDYAYSLNWYNGWMCRIWFKEFDLNECVQGVNQSKDLAFIQAVEQLIDKENGK